MDIVDMESVRSIMTVIAFATFAGIVLWAWSARKRGDFETAARSILAEENNESAAQKFTTIDNRRGQRQ